MLTPVERKALKAKAHKLEPVVQIGAKGITEEVIAEIDREDTFGSICERTGAESVQQVGKVCVLFRKRPDD